MHWTSALDSIWDLSSICLDWDYEKFGFMFNLIIAVAVTSAVRLLFTATEAWLLRYGATYACCECWFNADSMLIQW
jgi:hypothetical protein